jgi:hypothetical protein
MDVAKLKPVLGGRLYKHETDLSYTVSRLKVVEFFTLLLFIIVFQCTLFKIHSLIKLSKTFILRSIKLKIILNLNLSVFISRPEEGS